MFITAENPNSTEVTCQGVGTLLIAFTHWFAPCKTNPVSYCLLILFLTSVTFTGLQDVSQPVQCNSSVYLQQVQHTQDALSTKGKEYNEKQMFSASPLILYTYFCFISDILPQNVQLTRNIKRCKNQAPVWVNKLLASWGVMHTSIITSLKIAILWEALRTSKCGRSI